MKIVNRETFLAMPAGVLFSKYHPCVFEVPQIKGDIWPECGDFLVPEIVDAIECTGSDDFGDKCQLMEEGVSAAINLDCMGRDGSITVVHVDPENKPGGFLRRIGLAS